MISGLLDLERELETDREREVLSRRAFRDLGGGDGDTEAEVDLLLRRVGLGERDRDESGVGDLRRSPRSLLPRPLPP